MTLAGLQRKSDSASSGAHIHAAGGLRIGDAHDSYEQEADRVAERVSTGGHIGGWSLSKLDMSHVQREPKPDPAGQQAQGPKPDNYDEAAKKVGEAFLKTELGKKLLDAVKADPLVKGAEGFIDTLPGKIVAGAAATGVVSALAATHTALPAQIPEIPLDMVKPGLTVQITYEGPVDKPTKAMITFGYTPKADDSKKKPAETRAEKQRSANAVMAADQAQFREGMKSPADKKREAGEAQGALDAYVLHRQRPMTMDFGGGSSMQKPASPAGTPQLQMPAFQSPFQQQHAGLLDRKLELKPMSASDSAKKEDTPVQRKAAHTTPVTGNAASVHDVINRGGRPLDATTRRSMEMRFGFDFTKVRVHDDQAAAQSARALGAHAYTVGSDVVFGSGRYDPNSAAGRRLLAHELTHVVQQSRDLASKPVGIRQAPVQIQREADEAEEEKDSHWYSNPIEKAKKFVRKLPGYKLFTVILGKDPVTGDHVERNATTLLSALFNLVKLDSVFQRIQESGAIDKAFRWVTDQINALGLHWDYFKGLLDEAIASVSIKDLGNIKEALGRIKGIFMPAYEKVKAFALAAADKVLEFAMEAALALVGGTGIMDTFRQIGDTFRKIVKDPIGFLGHLVDALKLGFNNFKDHILEHLKNGVVEWIFGKVAEAGIKLPKQFDLAGIVNLILQVLGLTYDKFREKLKGLLGEEAVSFLEGSVDFLIQIVQAKSLAAAWKMILAKADKLVDTMLDSVRSWIVDHIVTEAVVTVVKMLNPAGAIIQAIQAIYRTVNFFIEKANQIKVLVDAIIKSIANIANGKLTEAANYVETTMGKAIPVMIGFLADQIGLGGIGKAVGGVIKKIQGKVDDALDKIINWVVEKGKKFYDKAKASIGKVLEWWKQRKDVLIGEEEHAIYMEGSEDAPKLMIASAPGKPWSEYFDDRENSAKKMTAAQKTLLKTTKDMALDVEKPLPPSKDDKEKAANVDKKRATFNLIAANIVKLGFSGDSKAPASVIRYGPVRAADGGGQWANASVLSSTHAVGTVPSDEPPIWKKLGSLVQEKNYVQGHLLNHNLGGEGRRFNLSPINKKANADHLNQIERHVKTKVAEGKVMSYKVKVVYGTHTEKPKRFVELQGLAKKKKITPAETTELKEYEAEQQLCTGFEYRAVELAHKKGEWVPKTTSDAVHEDEIKNTLEG